MDGASKHRTPYGRRSGPAGSPLKLLPRDIWVRIATKVANNSIQDLLNLESTCKVFFDAGRSAVVYKHAMVWNMPWVSFLRYPDRAERQFMDRCVDAGNPDAILRDGLHEYFFMARRDARMDLLTSAVS
ncbi:uncharacterized protein [Arachis hypogaea]|uniref:uncharacterized protein n=1 Tax=Arachis hypogaea TaxID=3818 RepID=UPI000DECEA2A|nr:uncharacterized protein LOC112701609 [Arachis hypogaea]QHO28925.1 putative F-box protein [Arachis hypogaea]